MTFFSASNQARPPDAKSPLAAGKMPRRRFLGAISVLMLAGNGCLLAAEDKPAFTLDASGGIIPAPDDPALWPTFRAALSRWRDETRRRLRYSDALYRRREFAWSASNYACCFLMTCDESFYDWRAGCYRVESLLDHGRREFGGYDSVVLWHAYPRIGVDQRNQFDFYRDLPGGLHGLRSVVRQFHRRGVRVYIDYNPWDSGTRRENVSDAVALCSLVRQIEADGIFLDTMSEGGADLRARLEEARRGVILEGEDAVPLEHVCDHSASWAQEFNDSSAPGVLKHKWFERRHMQHQIRRWDQDHTAELHTAWMNGSGMMIWENVFGSLELWNQRDRSILRAMLPIQRRFSQLFSQGEWTPLVPVEQPGIFASLWEAAGLRLWTLVNRTEATRQGAFLKFRPAANHRLFDLIRGVEAAEAAASMLLPGVIPPRGIACFVSGTPEALGKDFERFTKEQAALESRRDFSTVRPLAAMTMASVRRAAQTRVPAGMVEVPPATVDLQIEMRVRECGFYESTPPRSENLGLVRLPPPPLPAQHHFPALCPGRDSGDQRRLCALPPPRRLQTFAAGEFLAALAGWNPPRRTGRPPGCLCGFGRRPRLRPVGGQAPSDRGGMAIRGAGRRWPQISLGQRPGT